MRNSGDWEGMGAEQEWKVQKEKEGIRVGVGTEWEGRG